MKTKTDERADDPLVVALRAKIDSREMNMTRVAANLGVSEGAVRTWLRVGRGPKNALVRDALDKMIARAEK